MGDRANEEPIHSHSVTPRLARNLWDSISGRFYFYAFYIHCFVWIMNIDFFHSYRRRCIKYETKTFPSSQIWGLSNFGNGVPNAMARNDSNEPIKNAWLCLGPIAVNSFCSDDCEMARSTWIDAPRCFHNQTFPNILNASKNRTWTVVGRRTIILLFALNAVWKMKI